jgi:hypothetical protein
MSPILSPLPQTHTTTTTLCSTAIDHPSVYASGLYYMDLNMKKMLWWITKAVCHSVIVFWIPYGCYSAIEKSWDSDGHPDGIGVLGFTTFSCLVWAMTLQVSLQTLTWTRLHAFIIFISLVGWYFFVLAYGSSTFSPEATGVTLQSLSRPSYYLIILLVLGAMLLFDLSVELVRVQFVPNAIDVARELDAGFGVPGHNGLVRWGDEETEEEKRRAAAVMEAVNATAAAGTGSTDSSVDANNKSSSSSSTSSKNSSKAAALGGSSSSVVVVGGKSRSSRPSKEKEEEVDDDDEQKQEGSFGKTAASSSGGNSKASNKSSSKTRKPASQTIADGTGEAQSDDSEQEKGKAEPVAAVSAKKKSGSSKKKGGETVVVVSPPELPRRDASTDGFLFVPQETVLAGVDEEAKRAMGIVKPRELSHGFAYNYVSRRDMGTKSVAPVDGEEAQIAVSPPPHPGPPSSSKE